MSLHDADGSGDDSVVHDFSVSGPLDFASAHLAYVAQQEQQQEAIQHHQPQIVRRVDAPTELIRQNFSNALAGGSRDVHEGFSLLQGVRVLDMLHFAVARLARQIAETAERHSCDPVCSPGDGTATADRARL